MRRVCLGVAFALASTAVFAVVQSAPASAHLAPGSFQVGITGRGVAVGVDATIAAQHGFSIRTQPDGTKVIYSTKRLEAARTRLHLAANVWTPQLTDAVAPQAVVPAATSTDPAAHTELAAASLGCGSTYIYIHWFPGSNGKYQETTGFEGALPPAVAYKWIENITVAASGSRASSYVVNQGGYLLEDSDWEGQHTATKTPTPLAVTVDAAGTWGPSDSVTCAWGGSQVSAVIPQGA
jgi:hypothetical protein